MKTEKYPNTYESLGNCIECPYCGEETNDMHEYDFNDDCIEIECDCGKKFYVSEYRSVSYTGRADCELNREKHEYEQYRDGWDKCKICGNIEIQKSNEEHKQKLKGDKKC